ncbi:glycosyltransferase family 4 protein [Puniceicoccaceae bacterium K14]|nr:glycosyltransferase family 4 protein [Puniceicoccaceae bacterium K14]
MSSVANSSKESEVKVEVIIPNFGKRFSGVTSTMLKVLPYQLERANLVVWGKRFLDPSMPAVGLSELLKITKSPLPAGRCRVFHARRNIEMLWGLILKKVFRRSLKLIFTSTAQRKHSAYTRFLYMKMDAIVTTSNKAGSFLIKPADYTIPHGVSLQEYPYIEDKASAWSKLGFPGRRGIGIFGRVRPQKGIDLFVDAMIEMLPAFPEYTAVIVGKTTEKFHSFVDEQKKKILSAGLENRFVWLGEVDYEELPQLFGTMSIVAAVSRVEGFGLTCLEAMSSGTPVIASRTGGFELVVRDGVDGKLVPCGDSQSIALAFESMAKDSDGLAVMGRSARMRVETEFTVEREAEALLKVYQEQAAK